MPTWLQRVSRYRRWARIRRAYDRLPVPLQVPLPPWPRGAASVGEVVARIPADENEPQLPVFYSAGSPAELFPKIQRAPSLEVRRVRDVVLFGSNIMLSRDGELLPRTFALEGTRGGYIVYPAPGGQRYTAVPPYVVREPERIETPVFVADCLFDEYGHMLVDALPSLALLSQLPEPVTVVSTVDLGGAFAAIPAAFGIEVRKIDRPLICATAYIPDPVVNPSRYVHHLAHDAYARAAAIGETSTIARAERIYLSRSKIARRALRNEAEIEALFAAANFTIVHPQELPLADQVALVAGAKMIAGPAGSAMHSAVFARADARVLILSSPHWFAPVDVLFNRRGAGLGYAIGQTVPSPSGKLTWSRPWTIEVEVVRSAMGRHFGL